MEAFDAIDRYLRPRIVHMSFKYANAYNEREDVEQDMMEYALRLCYRYENDSGHFRHYVMRSIRFEMYKRIKEYHSGKSGERVLRRRSSRFDMGGCRARQMEDASERLRSTDK